MPSKIFAKKPKNLSYLNEFKGYFKETTVHGFRYLVDGRTVLERATWMAVIVSCFAYAGYLIHSNLIEWKNNPIISTIESTSTPVESIQFPTITVCPGDMAEADRWGFLEEVLNNLKFECYGGRGVHCSQTQLIRSKFRPMLESKFGEIYDFLKSIFSKTTMDDIKEEMLIQGLFSHAGPLENDILSWGMELALKNMFESRKFRGNLEKIVGDRLGMTKYSILQRKSSSRGILVDLHKEFIRQGFNVSTQHSNLGHVCQNDTFCSWEQKEWHLFLLACHKVFTYKVFGGYGTFMTHFSYLVGESFFLHFPWPKHFEYEFNPLEVQLNNFYAQIWREFSGEKSLLIPVYDVPALVGVMKEDNELIFESMNLMPWIYQSKFTTSQSQACPRKKLLKYSQEWIPYIYGRSKTRPCSDGGHKSSCCNYYNKIFGNRLRETMTAMRLSFPQGKGKKSPTNYAYLMKDYTFLKEFPTLDFNQSSKNYLMQLIPKCQYADESSQSPCELFEPMPTTNGVCHVFNGRSVSELYESSPYLDIFQQVYNIKDGNSVMVNASGDGDSFGLTFYLDANTRARPISDLNNNFVYSRLKRKSSFIIGVNAKDSPFNMKKNALDIETGRHTVIKVIPSQSVATENLRTVPIEKRKCRFLDEPSEGSMFNSYTQAGCQSECMMTYSQNKCGCTPWDYPQRGDVTSICDMMGSLCFWKKMKELRELANCDCVKDCASVSYTYSESSTLINSALACEKGFLDNYFYSKRINSWFPLIHESIKNQYFDILGDKPSGGSLLLEYQQLNQICQSAVNYDIALVTVKLGTPVLTTSVTTLRTSFAEQLAMFGGTVGLFTGMSFLSAFEIIFWLKRLLSSLFSAKKKKIHGTNQI